MFMRLMAVLVAVLISVSACTHHYTPTPDRYPTELIADFKPTGAVNLVNAQPSAAVVLVSSERGAKVYGKLDAWTNVAITLARRELAKRGMSTVPTADKTLKISIVGAHSEFPGWRRMRGVITLRVEIGDGYKNFYSTENATPQGFKYAFDGALMRAVVAMLNDEKVTGYLTK